MSDNQPPPYGGAPGDGPDPYGKNPYVPPPGAQPPPAPGIPSYPGGGQQDIAAYGQQAAPTGMPPLAHWGWRVVATLLDFVLFLVIGSVIELSVKGGARVALSIVVDLVFLCAYSWMEGTRGQSPGKMAVGTRVLRAADGQLLGFGTALGRRLLHILDALPILIGFLWPLWDEKRQTFADKLVQSVVIKQ